MSDRNKPRYCKKCGTQLNPGAVRCHACSAKVKKPFYKRILFWIVAAFAAMAVIGSFLPDSSSEGNIATTDSISENVTEAEEITAKKGIPAEKETTSKKETTTEKKTTEKKTAKKSNGDSASFREYMDAYEKFMNKYIEFMQSYSSSDNPISMMSEYLQILQEYEEYTEKIDSIDTDSLSTADYIYYMDVMNRVNKKLMTVH